MIEHLFQLHPNLRAAFHYSRKRTERQEAETAARRSSAAAENPPAELIADAANFLRRNEHEQFCGELETARAVWRAHRELVEADALPEPFASLVNDTGVSDACVRPGFEERIAKEAREVASAWIRNGVAEQKHGFVFNA